MSDGWIKLHRCLLDNPRASNPYWVSLWITLLLKATHTELKRHFGGKEILLKPGQLLTSWDSLADSVGCNRERVRRLAECMKIDMQIDTQHDNRSLLVSILNWSDYQTIDTQIDKVPTDKRHSSDTLATPHKKDKKEKKEKELVFSYPEHLSSEAFKKSWDEWVSFRSSMRNKFQDPQLQFGKQLEKLAEFGSAEKAIESINASIRNGWQGLFPPKEGYPPTNGNSHHKPEEKQENPYCPRFKTKAEEIAFVARNVR